MCMNDIYDKATNTVNMTIPRNDHEMKQIKWMGSALELRRALQSIHHIPKDTRATHLECPQRRSIAPTREAPPPSASI